MSALGHKRTFGLRNAMSALPPKADIGGVSSDVRYVPKADMRTVARYDWGPLSSKGSQDEPPATSSFHGRERRAESPHGRRCMEYARSQSRRVCVYNGQRLAKPIGILSGPRRH